MSLKTANLGYPRMGAHRELKFALESYWQSKSDEASLLAIADSLKRNHWLTQQHAGTTFVPSNDFSLYDHVLDMLVALGATPARFGTGEVTLKRYFEMARNSQQQPPMEMTKWFDTNYHYLVPEWSRGLPFQTDPTKLLHELKASAELGIRTRPVLIGPVSLLLLGKSVDGVGPQELLPSMLEGYAALLRSLHDAGVEWVQIDEPYLVTDLDSAYQNAYRTAYEHLAQIQLKTMLTTYFGGLGENLDLAFSLPVAGVHLDLVRAPEQLEDALNTIRPEQILSLGCVNGRNIWATDLDKAYAPVDRAIQALGEDRVVIAPSCSLLHVPVDVSGEDALPRDLKSWLSFAQQKLEEVQWIAGGPQVFPEAFADRRRILQVRGKAVPANVPAVREAISSLQEDDFHRKSPYQERAKTQRSALRLPLFPTTTIGSFPQTIEIRKARARWRKGEITTAEYEAYLESEMAACIRAQEDIGLDVLVHGEFERNDMVEYFGEQLAGFAFTSNGWVQSYGSRCVKPPIIYGDVFRPAPMTVHWSTKAQSLTRKPMKGMLTGPVTILQWSFVRDDISRKDVAFQIALALRDEVRDLESAQVRVIQIDEPALREGLPLRRSERAEYLDWAAAAFRLATSQVDDATQIHTHMCYSEFNDIFPGIAALDADVISIESARSRMELLHAFQASGYPNEIGPGVYDIHSTRIPEKEEMEGLLRKALEVVRPEQLWVNPDCGLKTRNWTEVTVALKNMCDAARGLREQYTLAVS
jgi:5-methyltetrahydropteroyltriglutamate--homocysteine methyltransferase